jgi:peptidylprolyl isomerase
MKKTAIIAAACLLCACTTEKEREAVNTQAQAIDNYINKQMADTSLHATLVVNNNSYRLIYTAGAAPTARTGDSVYFVYIGYIFSNGNKTPFDTNLDTLGFTPAYRNGNGIVGVGQYIPGLDNGLNGMQTGEKAEILFPASEGYGNATVGLVPPLSALLFDVEMIKIVNQ